MIETSVDIWYTLFRTLHLPTAAISRSHFYLPPADRPGTGDYKMPDVHPSVRACVSPFVTFYKKLHNSFLYEHKFTKLTQKVYANKGMSFITFGLILKNKMAAIAIFHFCIHR